MEGVGDLGLYRVSLLFFCMWVCVGICVFTCMLLGKYLQKCMCMCVCLYVEASSKCWGGVFLDHSRLVYGGRLLSVGVRTRSIS